MPNSVYIHIPFCKSKCKYCSFVSFTNKEKKIGYIFSLLKEIDSNYNNEPLKTLYFGGGTPSLLEIEHVKRIINKFNFLPDCEITFELNPDDANLEYLEGLKSLGINRLSMGAQSFDNEILKIIGRRHNSESIFEAIENSRKIGFDNINLDLIYGLPSQNINKLEKDINAIINLQIPHISTYGLKIEENSHFGKFLPENLPDDDTQADMYLLLNEKFKKAGLSRYEISNFSLANFESKHNLNYWNNDEYYGFGISAHGYVDGVRYSNFTNFEDYLNNPASHEIGHFVTQAEALQEEIFLGFRKTTGIDIEKINKKYSINFNTKYNKVLKKYMPEFICKTENGYALTTEGTLLSNIILAEFI